VTGRSVNAGVSSRQDVSITSQDRQSLVPAGPPAEVFVAPVVRGGDVRTVVAEAEPLAAVPQVPVPVITTLPTFWQGVLARVFPPICEYWLGLAVER